MMNNKIVVLIIILLFSLAIRLVLFGAFAERDAIETYEYSKLAENMFENRGYTLDYLHTDYKSFALPLYSGLIMMIYKVCGVNVAPVIYFQIGLSLFACIIVFLIARRICDNTAALIAAFLSAFHPGLIIYSIKKVHALNLDILLILAALLLAMMLKEKPSFRKAAFLGGVFGAAFLSRPLVVVFLVVILWLFVYLKQGFLKKCLLAITAALIMAIPVSSWLIRNSLVHNGKFVFTTTDTVVFWIGNNPNATGTVYNTDGTSIFSSDKKLFDEVVSLDDELEIRDLYGKEAVKFIKNNPAKFVALYFKKFTYFWWFTPVSGILYPHRYLLLYKAFYLLILPLAAVGLGSLFTKKRHDMANAYLLLFSMLSISLFQALYYVDGRHRWGIEPILMIFSAAGVTFLISSIRRRLKKESR